jgi:hypothetical protein
MADLTNVLFTQRTIPPTYLYLFAQPLNIEHLLIGVVLADGVAEAPSPEWDRRLELPFTLEVAAA